MKKPLLIIGLNDKMYLTGIRKMNGKKNETKWNNAGKALNTTVPHQKMWSNCSYGVLIPDLETEEDYIKWVDTDYLVKRCWIKKLSYRQTNVMLCLDRKFIAKEMIDEIGIVEATARFHISNVIKLLGAESAEDALLILKGLKK